MYKIRTPGESNNKHTHTYIFSFPRLYNHGPLAIELLTVFDDIVYILPALAVVRDP